MADKKESWHHERRAPTEREILAAINETHSQRDRLLLQLAFYAGGRIKEILKVHPANIIDDNRINLENEKNKGGRNSEKIVYVPDGITSDLTLYIEVNKIKMNEYVFQGRQPGAHLSSQMAWVIVKRACEQAGVMILRPATKLHPERLTPAWPHLFRHAAAMHWVRTGWPLPAIKAQLGHASLQSTDVYARIDDPDRLALVKRRD